MAKHLASRCHAGRRAFPTLSAAYRDAFSVDGRFAYATERDQAPYGANTLNCYLDRFTDRVMHRTSRRPLPRHQSRTKNRLWSWRHEDWTLGRRNTFGGRSQHS